MWFLRLKFEKKEKLSHLKQPRFFQNAMFGRSAAQKQYEKTIVNWVIRKRITSLITAIHHFSHPPIQNTPPTTPTHPDAPIQNIYPTPPTQDISIYPSIKNISSPTTMKNMPPPTVIHPSNMYTSTHPHSPNNPEIKSISSLEITPDKMKKYIYIPLMK